MDAHQHFWDPARAEYPWLTDDLAAIRRAFGPDDLRPMLDRSGIDRTVLVQTRASHDESVEFLATASMNRFVAGVVGWVDIARPDVADQVGRLRDAPGGSRLVGIRHIAHDEPDPDWLARPDIQRGIGEIGEAGLVYDILVRPPNLGAALRLVRSLPKVRFIIDHLAKPPIAAAELEPWATRMRPFGELLNVCCKVSGLVTEARVDAWTVEDLRPFVEVALEVFGPRRLLFGSDWPVCLLAAPYARVVAATRELMADLSGDELAAVFGGTAIEVYRLDG